MVRQSSTIRTPFTNLSQVDADLALARTLQEQERTYMMLRMGGDGSEYGSWEGGRYIHEDDEDFKDEDDDEDEDAFDVHAHAESGEDLDNNVRVGVERDPASFPNDEAYARALQDAEDREMAASLLASAGINEREDEEEDHVGNSQDTWEEVDPDELSYEVTHPDFSFNPQAQVVPLTAPSSAEDLELAMAISASIQSAMEESKPPYVDTIPPSGASTSSSSQSRWATSPAPPPNATASGSETQEASPSGIADQLIQSHNETPSSSLPSTPSIENAVVNGGASSSCVICFDAPVEGACVPCGHMTGCMSCLNEIKGRNLGCPMCRTQVDQVIRLYAV